MGRDIATQWLLLRVELTSGNGQDFHPSPGRDFLVSSQHTMRGLADAINAAFARWDLSHLHAFQLADGSQVGTAFEDLKLRDDRRTKVGRKREGEVFHFTFDFGDSWQHRCTVREVDVNPEDYAYKPPRHPIPVFGWGQIPDQYGRTAPESDG